MHDDLYALVKASSEMLSQAVRCDMEGGDPAEVARAIVALNKALMPVAEGVNRILENVPAPSAKSAMDSLADKL